jgi:predicted house-cleaning noncanonical NTP pyrophosphatase (MazG superfamily)
MKYLDHIIIILTALASIVTVIASLVNLRASRKKNLQEFQNKRNLRKNEEN